MAVGNTKQLLQKVQTVLRASTWGASSNKVFASGSVVVTLATTQEGFSRLRMPIALVKPLGANTDPEFSELPGLLRQEIEVRLVTSNAGDALGQKALMGSNVLDTTKSAGKGLMDVEEELYNAIEFMNIEDGVNIQLMSASVASPVIDEDASYVVFRDYRFTADVGTDSL